MYLIHPDLITEETGVEVKKTTPDIAGYRPIHQIVQQFHEAGIQLNTFRAAEFAGDMALSPIFQNYIDPVDRDASLLEALERSKQATADFEKARKDAIDKRRLQRENEIIAVADRLRRSQSVSSSESEGVQKEKESPPA